MLYPIISCNFPTGNQLNHNSNKMTKQGFLSLCLLLLALLFQGCQVDNIDPTSENGLTVDGASFEVTVATLVGVSMEDAGHAAISFTGTNGVLSKILTLNVEYSPSQPLDGTYAYPSENGARYLDNFLTNYTEMTSSGPTYATVLEKGTVSLKDNGDSNYTITIELTMIDGKIFKGTYRGEIKAAFNNG